MLIGWAGALSSMARRFFVRGSVGPPVSASCGFPEGCGLSCVAMMLIDQVWHEWVKADVALAQPLSFVDNWEILVSHPELVEASMDSTFRFAAALDLVVDHKKTFCWATTRASRRSLSQLGCTVRLHAKDLGARVTFSKQIRNATCVERFRGQRFRGLADFWDKLAHASEKASGLFCRMATCPSCRGCFLCGAKHFHRLRSEYMRALHLNKPGANSFLQFCLDGCCVDPWLAATKASLADFRDLGGGPIQLDTLSSIVQADSDLGLGTLHQVLVHRVHMLGWEVGLEGWAKTALVGSLSVNFIGMSCFFDLKWDGMAIRRFVQIGSS